MSNINIEKLPYMLLDLFDTGIVELLNLSVLIKDKMIVLNQSVDLLKLCVVSAKLMFSNQPAIQQQLDGVIKCSPTYPVFVVLHTNIECLYVKMTLSGKDLFQDRKTLGCLSMAMSIQIVNKKLSNLIKRTVSTLLHRIAFCCEELKAGKFTKNMFI